jgi:hypothetical protein
MPPMPALRTTTELYPPQRHPDYWSWLCALATLDRDENGNFVLERSLQPHERQKLMERSATLRPWITAAKPSQIAPVIGQMMISFGRKPDDEEAKVIATQYVSALLDLPLWCIQRACTRFASAEVSAEEVGAKKPIDYTYPPTTAQLRMIAKKLLQPVAEETTRIWMTVRGAVRLEVTEEQHRQTGEKMKEFVDNRMRRMEAEENEERARRRAQNQDSNRTMILRQYEAAGVEPHYSGDGNLQSLSLLLSVGWTIEKGKKGANLVRPPPAARSSRVTEGT